MFSSVCARNLTSKTLFLANNKHLASVLSRQRFQICRMSSTTSSKITGTDNSKRNIHHGPNPQSDANFAFIVQEKLQLDEAESSEAKASSLVDRFKITAEVTVSKIFPAGFGWQSSSILASNYLGYSPDSLSFALTTGFGDAVGVLLGHVAYFSAKKAITEDTSIDMNREAQTGLLLGSAAFFSGTAWQPIVNELQGADLPFLQVFGGTWLGCGAAFYLGLRLSRTILSGPFEHIHYPTFENGRTDKSLSLAIGGATGFFVGTDTAYLPSQNFLINVVGITDTTPQLAGCAIAGTSTSLGFLTAQSTLNAVYPTGRLWNDGK